MLVWVRYYGLEHQQQLQLWERDMHHWVLSLNSLKEVLHLAWWMYQFPVHCRKASTELKVQDNCSTQPQAVVDAILAAWFCFTAAAVPPRHICWRCRGLATNHMLYRSTRIPLEDKTQKLPAACFPSRWQFCWWCWWSNTSFALHSVVYPNSPTTWVFWWKKITK